MDPWIKGLWNAIKEELSNMTSKQTECVKEEVRDSSKESLDPSTADMQLNLLSIADCQNCKSVGQLEKLANLASPSVSTTQTTGSDVRPDSSLRRIGLSSRTDGALSADAGVTSLTHSLPPLSQSALNIPALPPPYLCVCLHEMETTEDVRTIDKVCVFGMFCLKSHSCFSSDFWTFKQRESSGGSHIKGHSVDQG